MTNMNLETLGDSLDGYTTGTYWTVIVNTMQTAILKTHGTPEVLFGETRTDQDTNTCWHLVRRKTWIYNKPYSI
jgi:hypothetical protein